MYYCLLVKNENGLCLLVKKMRDYVFSNLVVKYGGLFCVVENVLSDV